MDFSKEAAQNKMWQELNIDITLRAVYYNQAVQLNEAAAMISDNKAYKKALAEMNEVFKKSLPFFEKAHELDPQSREYIVTLKALYYRLHMDAKYEEMSEKLNNL